MCLNLQILCSIQDAFTTLFQVDLGMSECWVGWMDLVQVSKDLSRRPNIQGSCEQKFD